MRYRVLLVTVAVTAAVSVMGLAWPARAGTPPVGPPDTPLPVGPVSHIGVLDASHALLGFSGSVGNPTPLPLVDSPVQPVCAAGCREYTFTAPGRDPFLVSLKSTVPGPGGAFNADDGYDLYLYGPSGSLVAASSGIGSNGQSLSEPDPAPGVYTIEVNFTYAEDANAAYVGEVRLMSGSTWQPAAPSCGITVGTVTGCFELPEMRAVPAYDLAVSGLPPAASTPLGFPLPVTVPTSNSCYVDESAGLDSPSVAQVTHPTRRCLRFTSDVQNVGAGALAVRLPWLAPGADALPASGFVPGQCQAEQLVATPDGPSVARPAGACEFHAEHGHFHYKDLISFTLYQDGGTGGTGARVGSALKESFCLTDDDYFGFATAGPNAPRGFVGQPGCNLPSQIGPPVAAGNGGTYVTEGISPGWGDVYTWDTPDQYIDISDVPAGTYDLVEKTNPSGALLVSGPPQTCALTQLALTATSVKLLTTEASVACPA